MDRAFLASTLRIDARPSQHERAKRPIGSGVSEWWRWRESNAFQAVSLTG